MAALICTLGGLLKDDRVPSFRFLKSTPRRYGNSKKLCTDGIARFSKNLGFGNRTIITYTLRKKDTLEQVKVDVLDGQW